MHKTGAIEQDVDSAELVRQCGDRRLVGDIEMTGRDQ